MKLVKRISLFMTLSVIMLGLGGFGALKAEEFFYPHRYSHSTEQTDVTPSEVEMPEEEQVIEAAAAQEPVVTAEPYRRARRRFLSCISV